jgi:ubiquitin-protein ligase
VNKICRNKKIAGRKFDGKFCLINPDTNELIVMNEIATMIWELIESPTTTDELVEKIYDEYNETKEQIEKDVHIFIEKLKNSGMIRMVN